MEIKVARAIKRITQYDLANLTGIHPSKISLIENAKVRPTATEMKLIALALEMEVGDITWPEIRACSD